MKTTQVRTYLEKCNARKESTQTKEVKTNTTSNEKEKGGEKYTNRKKSDISQQQQQQERER